MEAEANAHVALNSFEMEVATPASYLACVIKERHIETRAGSPAKLSSQQQTVTVTKPIAGKARRVLPLPSAGNKK